MNKRSEYYWKCVEFCQVRKSRSNDENNKNTSRWIGPHRNLNLLIKSMFTR